jgi:fumarate hydratase subunit beta
MTECRLRTPLTLADVQSLEAKDVVFLSGRIYTARDKAHALICKSGSPVSMQGAALYHCGPLIREDEILSAGPTTSGRMARYTEEILRLGVLAIIGKGGLPEEPFREKAVYLAYPGGCGAAASRQLSILGVRFRELGMAEALWELEAKDLGPLIVAVDSHGRNLYKEVKRSAEKRETF